MARVSERRGETKTPKAREEAPAPEHGFGNQAMARMLAREVGWKGAAKGTANTEERDVKGVTRIPLDGLKGSPGRAIVVLPANVGDLKSVDILLHLHGFTPGYAGSRPDDIGTYNIEAQMAAA